MKRLKVLFLVGAIGVILTACGGKTSSDEIESLVNELPTDVVSSAESTVGTPNQIESGDDERVELDASEMPEVNEEVSVVQNKNRSSYKFDEMKFFHGLDTGSFKMELKVVNNGVGGTVLKVDMRGDNNTGIVKYDISTPLVGLYAGANDSYSIVEQYVDTVNGVLYTKTPEIGWVGAASSGIYTSVDDITVREFCGDGWAFSHTDEYYAYFTRNSNISEYIASQSLGFDTNMVSNCKSQLKMNRETLRMVDYTETFTIDLVDENGNSEPYDFTLSASIQDINELGSIRIPSDILQTAPVDNTKSNATVYD